MSETTCPICSESKQRIAQHWARSCGYPPLTGTQRAVIEGLLLAGGTVAGNGNHRHIISKTQHQSLAEWLATKLGWLCHSIRTIDSDRDRGKLYAVRTPAHRGLDRYVRWEKLPENSGRQPPDEYHLAPLTGRVWWALAGGIQCHGDYDTQITGTISAERDAKASWVQRILSTAGIKGTRAGSRIQLSPKQLRRWLSWIGEPVPGVEHKWSLSQDLYQAIREPSRSRRQTARLNNGDWSDFVPDSYQCAGCGRSFRRPAQHWAAAGNSCDWPPIDDEQRQTLDALAVSRANVSAPTETPLLQLQTRSRERMAWIATQLGWLVGKITPREQRGDTVYHLRTIAHPELESYLRWAGNNGVPPERITYSVEFGRLWYSRAGTLNAGHHSDTHSQLPALHIRARSSERRLDALESLLRDADITPARGDGRLIISQEQTRTYLRQIGPPAPGTAYKWILDEDLRQQARHRALSSDPILLSSDGIEETTLSLASFIQSNYGDVEKAEWDQLIASPNSNVVADLLGNGSWNVAMRLGQRDDGAGERRCITSE